MVVPPERGDVLKSNSYQMLHDALACTVCLKFCEPEDMNY